MLGFAGIPRISQFWRRNGIRIHVFVDGKTVSRLRKEVQVAVFSVSSATGSYHLSFPQNHKSLNNMCGLFVWKGTFSAFPVGNYLATHLANYQQSFKTKGKRIYI